MHPREAAPDARKRRTESRTRPRHCVRHCVKRRIGRCVEQSRYTVTNTVRSGDARCGSRRAKGAVISRGRTRDTPTKIFCRRWGDSRAPRSVASHLGVQKALFPAKAGDATSAAARTNWLRLRAGPWEVRDAWQRSFLPSSRPNMNRSRSAKSSRRSSPAAKRRAVLPLGASLPGFSLRVAHCLFSLLIVEWAQQRRLFRR